MSLQNTLSLAPVMFIHAEEDVYGDRAIQEAKRLIRQVNPQTEFAEISANEYSANQLQVLTSPSLFGDPRAVIITQLENANSELIADLLQYLARPETDIYLVLRCKSKPIKTRKIHETLQKLAVPSVYYPKITKGKQKADAIKQDVNAVKRSITNDAIWALIDAVGNDVRELLAATNQLLADVPGQITLEAVTTYFQGRIEASGFQVADMVVEGRVGEAIELTRHALATGTSAVAIVVAIGQKFRNMAIVLGNRSGNIAYDLKIEGWQEKQAKSAIRNWSANALAVALSEITRAERDVKGGSLDVGYALERAILAIGRARQLR